MKFFQMLLLKTGVSHWKNDGVVKINYENTTLKKDYIGSYLVENVTITVGTEYVSLKPKGIVLVNSWGRVDMMEPSLKQVMQK